MKIFRFGLNIWITLASLLSFLLGWVALAHAPKPVQPSRSAQPPAISAPALPTLMPLQSLQSGNDGSSFQNFQVQTPSNEFSNSTAPIFLSGGS